MSKGGRRTTQTTESRLDPRSQNYVDQMRRMATEGAGQIMGQAGSFFTGPETMSVADQAAPFINFMQLNALDRGAERATDLMTNQAGAAATRAGAFGGARHGALEAVGAGEIADQLMRGRAQVFGNALNQGIAYQGQQRALAQQQLLEPLMRQQWAQGMVRQGMGPVNSDTTQTVTQPGPNMLGQIAGLGLAAFGGPLGGWLGSKVGGLFGSGGPSGAAFQTPPGSGAAFGPFSNIPRPSGSLFNRPSGGYFNF